MRMHGDVSRLARMSRPRQVLFIVMLAGSIWPVWWWFLMRTTEPSGDPWGWLALGTAALLVLHNRSAPVADTYRLGIPTALLVAYAFTYPFLPPLLRAGIGMTAVAALLSSLLLDKRMDVALWGLLLLALPVIASFNFYLGYPLRVAVGTASAFLLQMNGFGVVREGVLLNWSGHVVAVDAPCSGVKMLWAGLYLSFALAALYRFGNARTSLLALLSLIVIIAANILRATALFFVETGIVPLPPMWHEGIGLIAFAAGAITLTYAARKLRETHHAA